MKRRVSAWQWYGLGVAAGGLLFVAAKIWVDAATKGMFRNGVVGRIG